MRNSAADAGAAKGNSKQSARGIRLIRTVCFVVCAIILNPWVERFDPLCHAGQHHTHTLDLLHGYWFFVNVCCQAKPTCVCWPSWIRVFCSACCFCSLKQAPPSNEQYDSRKQDYLNSVTSGVCEGRQATQTVCFPEVMRKRLNR